MRTRLKWLAFWTLLGLISSTLLFRQDRRSAAPPSPGWRGVAASLSAGYVGGLLAPVVAGRGRRFQVDRANFGRHFFIHLGASLDLALLHVIAAVSLQDVFHVAAGQPFVFSDVLLDDFTLFYHWNVLISWAILAVVHAYDYHRDLESRQSALAELERRVARPDVLERVLVEDAGRRGFVRTADIDWVEAAKNYVRLHIGERTYVLRSALAALEERLDARVFRRINRSALVNLDRIKELQPWFHGDAICILRSRARPTVSPTDPDRLFDVTHSSVRARRESGSSLSRCEGHGRRQIRWP